MAKPPVHHARGAIAAVAALVLGTGFGLGLAGRPRRGFAWLGVIALCAFLALVTPWLVVVALAVHLAAVVDTYLVARRSEQPLRLLAWPGPTIFAAALALSLVLRAFVIEAFRNPSSSMAPTLVLGDHFFINKLAMSWRGPERGELITFIYPCDRELDYIKRVVALGGDTVEVRCSIVYVNGKAVPQTLVDAIAKYDDNNAGTNSWYERSASRYREQLGSHTHDLFSNAARPSRERAPRDEGDARDFPVRGHRAPSCADADSGYVGDAASKAVLGTIVETKPEGAATCEPQVHFVVPEGELFVLGDNRDNSNDSRVWGGVPRGDVKGVVTGIWLSNGRSFDVSRIGRIE